MLQIKQSDYSEKLLFETDSQAIFQIINDGDNSEPKTLCGHSLIRIDGVVRESAYDCVLTALEMDELAKKWISFRNKNKTNGK